MQGLATGLGFYKRIKLLVLLEPFNCYLFFKVRNTFDFQTMSGKPENLKIIQSQRKIKCNNLYSDNEILTAIKIRFITNV